MTHIACMVDLETLGTSPSALILSIGVVWADLDAPTFEPLNKLYWLIEPEVQPGRSIDFKTVQFWVDEARKGDADLSPILENEHGKRQRLSNCLLILNDHFILHKTDTIWSRGSDFDLTLLKDAYERNFSASTPWNFRQVMCHRTITRWSEIFNHLHSEVLAKRKKTNNHNALEDAMYQLELLHTLWQRNRILSNAEKQRTENG